MENQNYISLPAHNIQRSRKNVKFNDLLWLYTAEHGGGDMGVHTSFYRSQRKRRFPAFHYDVLYHIALIIIIIIATVKKKKNKFAIVTSGCALIYNII